jgi:hypothetical protein
MNDDAHSMNSVGSPHTSPSAWRSKPNQAASLHTVVMRAGAGLIAASVLGFAVAGGALLVYRSWVSKTIPAVGTVVGSVQTNSPGGSSRRGGSSRSWREIVRFTDANGVEHEFTQGFNGGRFAVGSKVPVRYLPSSPSDAAIDHAGSVTTLAVAFGGFGGVFLAIGTGLRVVGRRMARVSAATTLPTA